MPRTPIPLETRLWAKSEVVDGHWLWQGATTNGGYGTIHVGTSREDHRMVGTHRVGWELYVGPIPEAMTLDHVRERCTYRNCFNPAHMEVVTQGENALRGDSSPAMNARKTHCQNDHEFTPKNTYTYTRSDGSLMRRCRECDRVSARERRERAKAATA